MNHELAKELKDAGFPFIQKKILTGRYDKVYAPANGKMLSADYELVPTLEELLEALPQEVFRENEKRNKPQLRHYDSFHLGRDSQGWRAAYKNYNGETFPLSQKSSSNALESVSRLWLALNKKPRPPKQI